MGAISSDAETGIGKWGEESFIQKFKAYADSTYQAPIIEKGEFNSVMPWTMYGQMEREDLAAIYTYLKTVSPISNSIVRFTPASK